MGNKMAALGKEVLIHLNTFSSSFKIMNFPSHYSAILTENTTPAEMEKHTSVQAMLV